MGVPPYLYTGKENMMRSLNNYLQTYMPLMTSINNSNLAYNVYWDQYTNVTNYPSLAFADVGVRTLGNQDMAFLDDVGNLGNEAVGDYLGVVGATPSGPYTRTYGRIASTDVEFNIQTNAAADTNAVPRCLQIRDHLTYLLTYSGTVNDETGAQLLPRIALYDFENGGTSADTNSTIWVPMEKHKVFIEQFIGNDPARPAIQRYHILARVYWQWVRQ